MGQLERTNLKNINLKTINTGGNTQSRVSVNEATVAEYAEALRDGVELPPVVVFYDGADFWLADGFHRYHAYRQDGRASIPADVHEGTNREAILYAIGANQAHGLRRTNEDKRKAVSLMLADPEWAAWSDRNIAKHCGVSVPFVGAVRRPAVEEKQSAQNQKQRAKEKPQSEKGCNSFTPLSVVPDQSDELAEAQHTVAVLADQVEELTAKLAVEQMDGSEEAKTEAAQIIADLRAQVKTLEAELHATRLSRDQFQAQCGELMRQLKMNKRELDKAQAA